MSFVFKREVIMLRKSLQLTSGLFFLFGLFFLSNLSALLFVVWLIPGFVFAESVIWLLVAGISIWMLGKLDLASVFVENLKKNWIIFPFIIFSGLSIFWSVYWEISLYRWLILLCTIITGGYIGLRYDIAKILKLLSVFGVYILLISAALVIFYPRAGIMNYYNIQGAWKGLYWHKNHMGLIATFMNILFLIDLIFSYQTKGRQKAFWGTAYLFSLIFVIQSDSVAAYMTTMVLHAAILLALFLLRFGNKIKRKHYWMLFAGLVLASIVLFSNMDFFLGLFGRNTTLTGRIPMWNYLFNTYFNKHPLIGYGFNAFWYMLFHRLDIQIAAGYPDPIVIADNGFIDILINTGYVGLVLFMIFYLGVWLRSFQYAFKAEDITGVFPVILMTFILFANISWSLLFENEGFFMLVMISVLFAISAKTPNRNMQK